MPRDRRPRRAAANRGQAARASRLSRGSSSPSMAQRNNSVASIIPRLFAQFGSKRASLTPTVPQQEAMAKTLQAHIMLPTPAKFAEMYDLVYRMTSQRTKPAVLDVANVAIRQCFEVMANKLVMKISSQQNATIVNVKPAQLMIEFHYQFFGSTLKYLSSALESAERCERANPKKPLLLHELACRAFTEVILYKRTISHYLIELVVVFFLRARERFHKEFLIGKHAFATTNVDFTQEMAQFLQTQLGTPQICGFMRQLIQMLLSLDQVNKSVFYRLVELPLLKRSFKQARQLSRDQLSSLSASKVLTMTDYLRWVSQFLQMDQMMLETQFMFPAPTVQAMQQLLGLVMASNQMDSIVSHPTTGFGALLVAQSYSPMRAMYKQIKLLHSRTKHATLLTALEQFVEWQFDQRKVQLASKHHFKRRDDMVDFVRELLLLKHQWDHILMHVFRDGPNADKMHKAVFRFFYETLLIHEGVAHALALYLHQVLQKNSEITDLPMMMTPIEAQPFQVPSISQPQLNRQFLLSTKPQLQKRCLQQFDASQMDRFQMAYNFLGLIQYMKDCNTFYDYCKHYLCERLARESSMFTVQQEMYLFDLLNEEIKRTFVDSPFLTSHVSNNQMQHKHFTHSLNDFKWIASDFTGSRNFWSNSSARQIGFLESFRILHAGIWKMFDYDRCNVPQSIANSYGMLEMLYAAKWKNKRLLLNTKYSKAVVAVRLWTGQPKPINIRVSLHQLAILEQFNQTEPAIISYEQLLAGANFAKEINAKLALLSLVHAGLLDVNSLDEGAGLKFGLNSHFYDNYCMSDKLHDLSELEQVNFWAKDSMIEKKTMALMQAFGVAERDVVLEASSSAAEDVAQNSTMILLNDAWKQKHSSSGNKTQLGAVSEIATQTNLGVATASGVEPVIDELVPQLSSVASSNLKHNAIELAVKIEAAVVRVVKQAKKLDSLHEIYQRTKTALLAGPAPVPSSTMITMEEVSKALLKLVDKKYIKRNQTGGFEYLID